jgi:hypothetical protein
MFVGHYGVSLAAKAIQPNRSLGGLFVATQLLDIVFGILLLVGVERVALDPSGVGPAGVELRFAPISHGVAGTLFWAAIAYLAIRFAPLASRRMRSAAASVTAAVVASHYLLDVVVHPPELPIVDHTVVLGLGVAGVIAVLVEAALLVGGTWLYLRATTPRNALGRYGMIAFVVLLLTFNLYVVSSPTPASLALIALSNLAAYGVLAGIGEWLDQQRSPAERMAAAPALSARAT